MAEEGIPVVHLPGWQPLRQVWIAQIPVDDGEEQVAFLISETTWASESEALDFIARRLPEAPERVPANFPEHSRVYGRVFPATIHSKLADGRIFQSLEPDWNAVQLFHLDGGGRVTR